jgi:hypothetical protein
VLSSLLRRLSLAALAAGLSACGFGASEATPPPFVVTFPDEPVGGGGPGPATPPPAPPQAPAFDADAFPFTRSLLFGSFPSDVVRFGHTLFANDADQVDADGARVVPIDVSGQAPVLSTEFATVIVHATDLVDGNGLPGDLANPPGFGFFLNDVAIADASLGFVLANAGGSDSTPTLSNLVAFDPVTGSIRQVVNLANPCTATGRLDSAGVPVPVGGFTQAGAEAVEYVPTSPGRGLLYVAMTNLVFGAPSFGAVKLPGTVQVYDVDVAARLPVAARSSPGLVTQTLLTTDHNPVALSAFVSDVGPWSAGQPRLLVTVGGTTGFDATGSLVPVTDASVEALDGASGALLGRFLLGLAGLAGTRPALGTDAAGHRVGFFPSSATGQVYLLRLDGLYEPVVDPASLAVLRGPNNGIPIVAGQSGTPGGNVNGIGLSPDGRTLVVAGFGNLFAFPDPLPGRLYLLGLPEDVVTGSGFTASFVPGATEHATVPGRTLGALVLDPNPGARPDVYVLVGGPMDFGTFLGDGPGSVGSLRTFGLIR